MSPAHVLGPTYATLKRRLKSGFWPPGTRLESARLAIELGVSITPVRDSLNRLSGERMVAFTPGVGFFVLRFSEAEIADMFDLGRLLVQWLIGIPWSAGSPQYQRQFDGLDHADRTAALFLSITERTRNSELIALAMNLNDRLHILRALEPYIIGSSTEELADLIQLVGMASISSGLRDRLTHYHVVRKQHASDFARMLNDPSRYEDLG